MDKLTMQTPDRASENFRKLAELFPNAVTETIDEDGEVVRAIDKDVLMQEIAADVVEGPQERYQFTWPGKKNAIALTNQQILKTLRLDRGKSSGRQGKEGSIDTENVYIEGNNLDALKLLQETYLGKVKFIYIDPPYNTGNDYIYGDNFSRKKNDYFEESGQFDEEGNRLFQNTESNGRFHTDWLNMIYPRLRVAKDLLSEDGLICISIDNNEIENLRKICDEIFGEQNCVAQMVWKNKYGAGGGTKGVAYVHEYILIYSKKPITSITCELSQKLIDSYSKKDEKYSDRGGYLTQPLASTSKGDRTNLMYTIEHEGQFIDPPKGGRWIWSKEKFDAAYKNNEIVINKTETGWSVRFKQYLRDEKGNMRKGTQLSMITNVFNQEGTKEFAELMGDKRIFDFPKPVALLKQLLKLEINGKSNEGAIVLDFFSGSGSMAHATIDANSEDGCGRKFIMVQLPELCGTDTVAKRAGFESICDIGEERIRRAGKKIKDEAPLATKDLDIGFRVFTVDSSNMKDVYYRPTETSQNQLEMFADNVKEDRTPEDLLIQVMLELGILLSSKIEEKEISGKKVFYVADGYLIACFDADVTEDVVTEIAKQKPFYAVFQDRGLANDSVAANFEQIFETYSPKTQRKVL